MGDKQSEHKLARNPLGHGSAHVDLPSQVTHHFVETFDCIRYTVDRFQTFTYGPINCDSRECELQTSVNPTRGTRAQGYTHAGSDNQGILPLATRQCCLCPLSQ